MRIMVEVMRGLIRRYWKDKDFLSFLYGELEAF